MEKIIFEQPGKISRLKADRISRLIQAFFSDPENIRLFEEWKASQEQNKEETA